MAARFTLALAMMERSEVLSNPWCAKSFSAASRILRRVSVAIENSYKEFKQTIESYVRIWPKVKRVVGPSCLGGIGFGDRELRNAPLDDMGVGRTDGPMDIRLGNC